jgi:hypothetical protein
MREYNTGAKRSEVKGKPQYEGYLSPLVIWRYGQYMLGHQMQEDGNMRASDNWQKGMPLDDYMDSMWRHFMDVWLFHRAKGTKNKAMSTPTAQDIDIEDALCALMFNVMGYLHESIKK